MAALTKTSIKALISDCFLSVPLDYFAVPLLQSLLPGVASTLALAVVPAML